MIKKYRVSYCYTVQVDGAGTYSRHSTKNVDAYDYLGAARKLVSQLKKRLIGLTHVYIEFCQQQVSEDGRKRWASINTDLFRDMQLLADESLKTP